MRNQTTLLLGCVLLAALGDQAQVSYTNKEGLIYTTTNGAATITGYCGLASAVTIPGKLSQLPVTSIGDGAFLYGSLTSVSIPSGVTNIGNAAFEECYGLTNAPIPDGVISIGDYAFWQCAMSSVSIPDSVTNLGYDSFYECALTNVSIGEGITCIQEGTFQYCISLSSVTLPQGIGSIGPLAFANCYGLSGLTLPEGLTNIGSWGFQESGLTNVTIPGSVTSIGSGAFGNCYLLQSIDVDAGNPDYSSDGGVLFDKGRTTLIQYPAGGEGTGGSTDANASYAVPWGVTTIASGAFSPCSLSSVTIPNSVIQIGGSAFSMCHGLMGVCFLGNAPSADASVFAEDPATDYYLPGTAGWSQTFYGIRTETWAMRRPVILSRGPDFGVGTNGFGFTISWSTNLPVIVEVCTNLAFPSWQPLQTVALTNGLAHFCDPQWTNGIGRFYRVRQAGAP
jgi:hypothetical protein